MTRDEEVELVRRLDQASPSAIFATSVWAYTAIIYGLALIVGGEPRWRSPAYVALNQVPGSPYVWAALYIAGGLAVKVGCWMARDLLRDVGIWSLVVMFLAFAGCFLYAACVDPHAPLGPVVIYAAIALHIMVLQRLRGYSVVHP